MASENVCHKEYFYIVCLLDGVISEQQTAFTNFVDGFFGEGNGMGIF